MLSSGRAILCKHLRIPPNAHYTPQSGPDSANPLVEFLVRGMGVAGGRERAGMPREALGEVEVLRGAVHVRDRGVAKRVEGIDRLESRLGLPFPEHELNPPERDPPPLVREEEGRPGLE